MRSLVSKSYDNQTITIQFERYSPSSNWESSNKAQGTFKVYYRPLNSIESSNASYRINSSTGTSISKNQIIKNDNALTGIYISWNYDTGVARAGYTQGYRIRLYNSSGNVVKTYYTTSKNYNIPKADIPKLQRTYIDITPYYGNDQANLASSSYAGNYWYYNGTINKFDFVKLVSSLDTPTITYPINGSNWINDDFRICFQLPNDPDKANVSGTYYYENIEYEINGKYYKIANSNGTTTGAIIPTKIYNYSCKSSELTYQRKMIIWPNSNNDMVKANSYKIRVRVKKKYEESANMNYGWSNWSNYVTISKTISTFNPSVEDIIYASHYNNARALIDRIRSTYNVSWNSPPDKVIAGTTVIYRNQYPYDNLYNKLVETKNQVNKYGDINSECNQVKFDYNDNLPTSFTTAIEYVTALSENNNPVGKNYMKIIYDRANYLK